MKRAYMFLLSLLFVVCSGAAASAIEFTDSTVWTGNIHSDGTNPEKWFKLDLPTQANSGWDYDSEYVTKFDIALKYKTTYDDSIEIFLDFDSSHSSYYNNTWIGQFNPKYNGLDQLYVFSILDLGLQELFDGKSSFWIGYGCHFFHYLTEVKIAQNTSAPEPTTMLLLGSGLAGLASLGRKKRKN